jgi:ribosomal protein S6--L-glutamate ligase
MKIAILSNGTGNYSTKRLVEVAKARGHQVKVIKYRECYASIGKKTSTFEPISGT